MSDQQQPNWAKLVELHGARVFRVAMRVLGSVQDAEDVSQEVFVEVFQMHQAGRVKSWPGLLVRLATLRSIDRLRKSRHAVELSERDGVSDEEPYEQVAAAELAASLRQGIATLPEQTGSHVRHALF
jgi:RNA polymerase sigma factor (sigma-70 family)